MSRQGWQKVGGVVCLAIVMLILAEALRSLFHADTRQTESFPQWAVPPVPGRPSQQAIGIVDSVNAGNGTITIDHGPSQAMGWPSLVKVRYLVLDRQLMQRFVVGERVAIAYRKRGYDLEVIDVSAPAPQ